MSPRTLTGGNKASRVERNIEKLERDNPEAGKQARGDYDKRVAEASARRAVPRIMVSAEDREAAGLKAVQEAQKADFEAIKAGQEPPSEKEAREGGEEIVGERPADGRTERGPSDPGRAGQRRALVESGEAKPQGEKSAAPKGAETGQGR